MGAKNPTGFCEQCRGAITEHTRSNNIGVAAATWQPPSEKARPRGRPPPGRLFTRRVTCPSNERKIEYPSWQPDYRPDEPHPSVHPTPAHPATKTPRKREWMPLTQVAHELTVDDNSNRVPPRAGKPIACIGRLDVQPNGRLATWIQFWKSLPLEN